MMKTNKSITEKLPWWHHHSAVVRIFFKFIFSPTFSREFPVFFFVFFFIVASHQILPTALFKGFKAASTQRTTHWFQGEWKSYLRSCVGVNKTSLSETNIFFKLFILCLSPTVPNDDQTFYKTPCAMQPWYDGNPFSYSIRCHFVMRVDFNHLSCKWTV